MGEECDLLSAFGACLTILSPCQLFRSKQGEGGTVNKGKGCTLTRM